MLSILFIYFNHYHDSKTLGFIYFLSLKIHRKPLVYAAQCRVPGWTPWNKSGFSKVTLTVGDMWLRAKNHPRHTLKHFVTLPVGDMWLHAKNRPRHTLKHFVHEEVSIQLQNFWHIIWELNRNEWQKNIHFITTLLLYNLLNKNGGSMRRCQFNYKTFDILFGS